MKYKPRDYTNSAKDMENAQENMIIRLENDNERYFEMDELEYLEYEQRRIQSAHQKQELRLMEENEE